MKRVVFLLCGLLGLGCSAAEPDAGETGGSTASPAAAGVGGSGGATATAGSAGAGASPAGAPAGGAAASGGSGDAGGATGGGTPAGSSGTAGSAASSSAGAGGGGGGCVPNSSGALSVVGETVHDAKTCLDWMKATQTGVNYEAAEEFCSMSTLGGFDDWRIPNVHEFASTVALCGKYPPEGPVDTKFFDQQGDGYWTSTPAGEPNKVCAVGMANAGGYYHYGTAGPQVVRCVRGTGAAPMVKDCATAQGCSSW